MLSITVPTNCMQRNPILAESSLVLQVRAQLGGWGEGGSAEEEEASQAEAGHDLLLGLHLLHLLRHEGILPHPGEEQDQEQGRLSQRMQNPLASIWGREQCNCDIWGMM